jgi:hypothetical protein
LVFAFGLSKQRLWFNWLFLLLICRNSSLIFKLVARHALVALANVLVDFVIGLALSVEIRKLNCLPISGEENASLFAPLHYLLQLALHEHSVLGLLALLKGLQNVINQRLGRVQTQTTQLVEIRLRLQLAEGDQQ